MALFDLVRLIVSGGSYLEDERENRIENMGGEKKIESRWEFIDEVPSDQLKNDQQDENVEEDEMMAMLKKAGDLQQDQLEIHEQHEQREQHEQHEQQKELQEGEEENNGDDIGTAGQGKKKKKKKNNRRKRRSNSVNSMEESKRTVHWGDVEEIYFSRELGYHTVPNGGNYPLGLGDETSRSSSTIDQHLASIQIKLLERALEIGLDLSPFKSEPVADETQDHELEEDPAPRISLETRQYDYRRGYNPLFRPFSEADRIVVLGNLTRQSTAVDGISIATLNKELVEIRKSREEVGCNCKQMKLDKLNVAKLRQELVSYQETNQSDSPGSAEGGSAGPGSGSGSGEICQEILTQKQIDSLSKSELVNRLRGVYKSCPLCVLNDCSCVAAGVKCHSNVCGCFRAGGIKNSCENPSGFRIYNSELVKEYRKPYLTADQKTQKNGSISTNSTPSIPARSRAYST